MLSIGIDLLGDVAEAIILLRFEDGCCVTCCGMVGANAPPHMVILVAGGIAIAIDFFGELAEEVVVVVSSERLTRRERHLLGDEPVAAVIVEALDKVGLRSLLFDHVVVGVVAAGYLVTNSIDFTQEVAVEVILPEKSIQIVVITIVVFLAAEVPDLRVVIDDTAEASLFLRLEVPVALLLFGDQTVWFGRGWLPHGDSALRDAGEVIHLLGRAIVDNLPRDKAVAIILVEGALANGSFGPYQFFAEQIAILDVLVGDGFACITLFCFEVVGGAAIGILDDVAVTPIFFREAATINIQGHWMSTREVAAEQLMDHIAIGVVGVVVAEQRRCISTLVSARN